MTDHDDLAVLPGLVGFGYQGKSVDALVAELRAARVTRLIDVRLTPWSRKPGFAKASLSVALTAAGVAYEHAPALGNPKPNRPGFSASAAELNAARATYAARLADPTAVTALDALIAAARRETVAVLCFEADPASCHRSVLIEVARTRAVSAVYGCGDG